MAPKRRPALAPLLLGKPDIKEKILIEYDKLKDIIRSTYPDIYDIYDTVEKEISSLRCIDPIGHGDKKHIFICKKGETIYNIVSVTGNIDNDELLRHIYILQIYYTNGGISLGFNIPKIYLKFTESNISYYMDYINIKHDEIIYAKTHIFDDERIGFNIGKILGLHANINNELLYDFEIYKDEANTYNLLDFGEYIDLNQKHADKYYNYSKSIYDGIYETYNDKEKLKCLEPYTTTKKEHLDKLHAISKISDEKYKFYLEKLKYKYLKYKQKYLELKRNISIE